MSKIIKYGLEAKQAIKAGVDKAADVVKVTLGPTGRTSGSSGIKLSY